MAAAGTGPTVHPYPVGRARWLRLIPVAVIALYLLIVKRLGAFEAL